MTVEVIVQFHCKDALALNELVSWVASEEGLPLIRRAEGCRRIDLLVNREGNQGCFVETWDSKEAHQTFMDFREISGTLEKLAPLLSGPPEVLYFSKVDIDDAASRKAA